jgi:exopolysaccharide production protein ExoQ
LNQKLLNQFLGKFLATAEVGFVVFYLLFAESTSIPAQLSTVINALNYAFIGVVVWRLWKRMAYVISLDRSLLVLIGFTIASLLWSVDADFSIKMLLGMIRTTLFGIYLATCFSFQNHLRIFAWVSGWIVAINLVVYLALPSIAMAADPNQIGQVAFVGIYTFKQQTGRIMALALITLLMHFWVYARYRWLSAIGIVGATYMLWLAHSSTYVMASGLAIALFPLHQIVKQGSRQRSLLLLIGLFAVLAMASGLVANWENIAMSSGKGITFNGRTPVWTLAIEQLVKRPLLGYGYSAFWGSEEGWQAFRGVPWAWAEYKPEFDIKTSWTAHNGFLDVALQLGLVGLALLCWHILLVIGRSLTLMQKTHSWESLWMLQILAFQLVGAGFEPATYLASNNIHWIIYVAMAYSAAALLQRLQSPSIDRTIADIKFTA